MDYYKIRELAYPYNYVVSAASIFLSISGAILSTLVLHIILKNKWSILSIDLKLICFTLLFDLLMCFYSFVSGVCNLVGFAGYLNSQLSCGLNAAIAIFSAISSINLVGVIALERYFLIVKQKVLSNRAYFMIIFSLQLINLLSVVISGIFKSFIISSTSVHCIYNTETWAGIIGAMFLALSTCLSIFMIYYSYISIMIKRRKLTLKNLKVFPFKAAKIKKDTNSTIIKSYILIIAGTITTLPFCILLFISPINPKFLTPLVMTLGSVLSMLNMIINTIVVLRLRIELWQKFKKIFHIKSDNDDVDDDTIDDYQLTIIN